MGEGGMSALLPALPAPAAPAAGFPPWSSLCVANKLRGPWDLGETELQRTGGLHPEGTGEPDPPASHSHFAFVQRKILTKFLYGHGLKLKHHSHL